MSSINQHGYVIITPDIMKHCQFSYDLFNKWQLLGSQDALVKTLNYKYTLSKSNPVSIFIL